jgi:hypothetical protein
MTAVRGRCLCGGVRFEVDERPETVRYCHCTSCKKLSGGGGTVNARVSSSSIRILEGQELLQTYQPMEGSAKTFCRSCGSNLFGGGWPESDVCSVRVTTFEEPLDAKPRAHLYVRSLAEWETLPDDGLERVD